MINFAVPTDLCANTILPLKVKNTVYFKFLIYICSIYMIQVSHKVTGTHKLHLSHSRVALKSLASCTWVVHESFAVNHCLTLASLQIAL